jgi:pyrroloquinoline-quinone synthase
MTAEAFEAALREIGAERYHSRHPFHARLHNGELAKGQVQAWALNRYCYQAAIPRKDAALIARTDDPELRRHWRCRLADHDGDAPGEGGLARWLALAEGVGLDREAVRSQRLALPATQFACEAYVRFVAERSLLEAVASSLTELFAPTLIAQRVSGMLANYSFVDESTLAYFDARLSQAPQDSGEALAWVTARAETREQQDAALDALRFKCNVLWAMLDALDYAYVTPGNIPPGAFDPAGRDGLAP